MREDRARPSVVDLLLSSFQGRRASLLRVAGWSLLEAAPAYLSGRLVAQAVDHGFLVHRPATGVAWLSLLGGAVLVGGVATGQVYPNVAALVEPLRDRLVTLSVRSALRRSTSRGGRADTAVVARVSRQVEIVREAYASLIVIVQGFLVTTVSAVVGLAGLAPDALLFVLPPLLLGLGLFLASIPALSARQQTSILADERLSEITSELVGSRRDILACGGEPIMEAAASRAVEAQAAATRSLARMTAVRNLAVSIGGLLPVLFVLLGGSWLERHGATTGTILGVLTYVLGGVHPALQTLVRGLGSNGVWLLTALRRLLHASQPEDIAAPPPRRRRSPGPNHGGRDIRLRGVTFSYGAAPEPVVRDLDLLIPDGDHLVVVGPSGIGKSTLAGLLSGLLAPQAGEVLLGNRCLLDMDGRELAAARVLIPEEAYVFGASLRENLVYLSPRATRRSLDSAVDLLGARSLVERLGGYRAEVDPRSMSAGERQLIALVRSYIAPARVAVLDEATCHLDPPTEARVERAFARRPGALVVVAHRISSAVRAKRILVMDGQQSLIGTHAELLARSGLYRDLVGCWTHGAARANGQGTLNHAAPAARHAPP